MSLQTEKKQMPSPPYQRLSRNTLPVSGEQTGKREGAMNWVPTLVLLALLVVLLGSDFRQMTVGPAPSTSQAFVVTGPFVQTPFSPIQVDKLYHLSSYVSDKTLAKMYLSRMTLDQKLG